MKKQTIKQSMIYIIIGHKSYSCMTKTKQQQKEDDMILLSWEDYSKKHNVYSLLVWIVYIILFIPMLIAWIIIEMRKD